MRDSPSRVELTAEVALDLRVVFFRVVQVYAVDIGEPPRRVHHNLVNIEDLMDAL